MLLSGKARDQSFPFCIRFLLSLLQDVILKMECIVSFDSNLLISAPFGLTHPTSACKSCHTHYCLKTHLTYPPTVNKLISVHHHHRYHVPCQMACFLCLSTEFDLCLSSTELSTHAVTPIMGHWVESTSN